MFLVSGTGHFVLSAPGKFPMGPFMARQARLWRGSWIYELFKR